MCTISGQQHPCSSRHLLNCPGHDSYLHLAVVHSHNSNQSCCITRVLSQPSPRSLPPRRKPAPSYGDRVYDTLRCEPNAVERRLFMKAWCRRALMMREAARIVARGPMGGQENIVVEVGAGEGRGGVANCWH